MYVEYSATATLTIINPRPGSQATQEILDDELYMVDLQQRLLLFFLNNGPRKR